MQPEPPNTELVPAAANPIRAAAAAIPAPAWVEFGAEVDRAATSAAQRPFSPASLLPYRWSILACFLALSALAVAGIWVSLGSQYRATAKIEISPVVPQLLHEGGTDMIQAYEGYRSSQVDHITGMEVLQAVLGREKVRATNWYQATPATRLERWLSYVGLCEKGPPLDRLAEAVTAEAPHGKQHIYVSMSASTPGEAKLVIDAVVEEYAKFANRRASDSELDRIAALRNEIRTRERDLAALQERAADLRSRLGTGSPERLLEQRLLRVDLASAQLRTAQAKYAIATQASAVPPAGESATSQPSSTTLSAAWLESDREWQRLNQEFVVARRDLESASSQLGELHPVITKLRTLVEYAETQVKTREAELAAGGTPDAGADGASVHELAMELEVLGGTLAQDQKEFEATFRDAEALIQINTTSAQADETLAKLRREMELIEMNRQVAGRIQTWAAYEPIAPEKDRRWKLTIASILGSLAAGIGIAFLRIRMSPTVNAVAEVPAAVEPGFFGRLPLQRNADFATLESCLAVCESVRLLRTTLLNRLERYPGNAIQVTSASPGSGKSTLTILLAKSLAQLGKRVLLVDADVRRPALAEHFAVASSPGLVEVLRTHGPAGAAIRATELPTLSLLPAGDTGRPADRELLANGALSGLLEQLRRQYDIVLFDSAPLLEVADAAILSRQVDGTILVIREQHCRRAALRDALATLDSAGGRLVGTVFVGFGVGSAYGYGYEYGNGHEAGPAPRVGMSPDPGN